MKKILIILFSIFSSINVFAQFDAVKKAAEEGDVDAQMYMAKAYEEGRPSQNIKQDIRKAIEWYVKAAQQGNAEAQFKAAYHIIGNLEFNEEIERIVITLLRESADSGFVPAQVYLGSFLTQVLHKFQDKGFDYLNKAKQISPEDAAIDYYLAYCYYYGEGTELDLSKAEKHFQISADADINAGANLYVAYCAVALRQDYNKAKIYYQKAIDAGIPQGYNDMAYLYAEGNGVKQDFNEAHRLVDIALSKDINKVNFLDSKGEFYLMENNIEEATKIWNKIVSMDKEFAQSFDSDFCNTMRTMIDGSIDMNIATTDVVNSNTYAVIIANENYKREEKVPFAESDGKVFKEYCTKTLGIPESNIKIVFDATYNDIRYATNWLKQVIAVTDGKAKVLFYYAGHGIPDESTKSAYLLPVDGYGTDVSTGYSLENLYNLLGNLSSQSAMVFLDACFSGTKREGDMLSSARGVAIKVKSNEPKGRLVVFSAAQGDETAYPYKEQRHGMFTYYLLKKLQETKGNVTLGELSDYVTTEVKKTSIVTNGKMQTPTLLSSSLIADEWRNWKLK